MIDTITDTVPQMLATTLPKEVLATDIVLKILPISHPHIPQIIGRTKYQTAIKLLQFFVTTMLLPPTSQLQILSARLTEDKVSTDSNMSKFTVHWRTVSPDYGDEDSDLGSTSSRSNGNERSNYPSSWTSNLQVPKLARTLSLLPHEYPVLVGIFEFEFSLDCKTIATHVITDVEYLSKPEFPAEAAFGAGA